MVAIFRRPADGQAGGGDKALKPAEREGAFEEGGCVEETLRRPGRRDSLPEHTRYLDTGCDIHHSCLTCPLVRCRYDEPGGMRRIVSRGRDSSILRGRLVERLTIDAIADRFGVSRRTVFRVLARARSGEGETW